MVQTTSLRSEWNVNVTVEVLCWDGSYNFCVIAFDFVNGLQRLGSKTFTQNALVGIVHEDVPHRFLSVCETLSRA